MLFISCIFIYENKFFIFLLVCLKRKNKFLKNSKFLEFIDVKSYII